MAQKVPVLKLLLIAVLASCPGCRVGYEIAPDAGFEADADAGVSVPDDGDPGVDASDLDDGLVGDQGDPFEPGDDRDAGTAGDDGDSGPDGEDADGDSDPVVVTGWTWAGGSATGYTEASYGELGVPDPDSQPGGRNHAGFGTDTEHRFWLMGGFAPGNNRRNDLWRFEDGQWVWLSGSQELNQPPVYGPRGEPSPAYVPGAVEGHAACADEYGNFWMFGGWGFAGAGNGETGDLWRYNADGWAWMAGSQAISAPGVYGQQSTPDPLNYPGCRQYNGLFSGFGGVWVFGGYGRDENGDRGRLEDLWYFDGTNWTWFGGSSTISTSPGTYGTQGQFDPDNWPSARTYATFAWMHGGQRVFMFGGKAIDEAGTANRTNELWAFNGSEWAYLNGSKTGDQPGVYGDQGIPSPGNGPGSRTQTLMVADAQGNLWLFGGTGYDEVGDAGSLNDLWKFDGEHWTWMDGSSRIDQPGLYPPEVGQGGELYTPGARFSAAGWVDAQGRFWLYGGYGYDADGTRLDLNDLWIYQPPKGGCFGL